MTRSIQPAHVWSIFCLGFNWLFKNVALWIKNSSVFLSVESSVRTVYAKKVNCILWIIPVIKHHKLIVNYSIMIKVPQSTVSFWQFSQQLLYFSFIIVIGWLNKQLNEKQLSRKPQSPESLQNPSVLSTTTGLRVGEISHTNLDLVISSLLTLSFPLRHYYKHHQHYYTLDQI